MRRVAVLLVTVMLIGTLSAAHVTAAGPVAVRADLRLAGTAHVMKPAVPGAELRLPGGNTDTEIPRESVDALVGAVVTGTVAVIGRGGSLPNTSRDTAGSVSLSNADDYPEDTIARAIVAVGLVAIALLLLQLVAGSRRRRTYR